MQSCESSPSGELLKAFGEFNRGEWFECHETLEELWIGEQGEMRDFLQGIIQVAVALHHWRNGNYPGAMSLLGGGIGYLRRVPATCQRIDVAALIVETERAKYCLAELGSERMAELPTEMLPRMKLV